MPAVRREDEGELRAAAAAHRAAGAPASHDQRRAILAELRVGTLARAESDAEAITSFNKLMVDLADVPADILHRACKAYVNYVDPEPKRRGARFFPRSAAEIRMFSDPMQMARARRAYRLDEMAKAAAEAFDPSTRCGADEAAAIMAEFGLRSTAQERVARHDGPVPTEPTREALEQVARAMGIPIAPESSGQNDEKAKAA